MDILKPLLALLGMSGRRANKQARTMDQIPQMEPRPIHLSAFQGEQIERKIAEFIEDSTSVHADARGAVARLNALPLLFDWTAFMVLRLDGQIVWVPYDDEPGDVESVREKRLRISVYSEEPGSIQTCSSCCHQDQQVRLTAQIAEGQAN